MPRDDNPIEFLVTGPDTGSVDEELEQPVGFPRLRRARLPLLIAGAVAAIALVVVNTVAGPSGSPSAAQATVTVSPSPTQSLQLPSGRRTALRSGVLPAGVTCPLGASCAVLFTTPKLVTAAVHDALPSASALRTVTTISHRDSPGSQLRARHVVGRIGVARLSIEVTPAGRHDQIGWDASEDAARTRVTATRHVRGELVSVRVTAPPGYEIRIGAVRRLTADPRLVRLT